MARRGGFDMIGALENLALLGAVGVGAYYLFEMISKVPSVKDPTTGQSVGPINELMNALVPMKFPGGGEVAGSSETYTGAATESMLHPFSTLATLVGLNQTAAQPAPALSINTIVPGTGMTVAELENLGYTPDEIYQMIVAGSTTAPDTALAYANLP